MGRCHTRRVNTRYIEPGAAVLLPGRLCGWPKVGIELNGVCRPCRNQPALDHAVDLARFEMSELDYRIDGDRHRRVMQDQVDFHWIFSRPVDGPRPADGLH